MYMYVCLDNLGILYIGNFMEFLINISVVFVGWCKKECYFKFFI